MMTEDTDSVPDREMKDFQFRQLKKIRLFAPPGDLPKERSNLLVVSNKYGLTFAGQDGTLKVFFTRDLMAVGHVEANPNEIVENVSAITVSVNMSMHHLALSSDELTLSVCGTQDAAKLTVNFYDVRTFYNKSRQEKHPFASFSPANGSKVVLQDLKWSPVEAFRLALCLSDGSMMVLDVQDSVNVLAQQPASVGVTCVCWSPKGKQVAVGKQDATVVQFTPTLQAKKVIPCPRFYSQDNPVKVLDVLWLSTYTFGVVYAAADGSLETPPDLVMVSLPSKTDQRAELYMNFNDLVFGVCTVRQHHFYLCHIEDWDLVLAASAASAEVSVIAKQQDKVNWELWILEDASRAELPVTDDNEDTLPVGVAIDYTSQEEIQLSDEKRVPPVPTLMILSTDGVLCPFTLLNLNPGVKPLTKATSPLPVDGERAPSTMSLSAPAVFATIPSFPASSTSAPPPASLTFAAPPPAYTSSAPPPPRTTAPPPASSSTGFSFSLPSQGSVAPSHFSLNSTSSLFSAPKPSSEAPSGFSFGSASLKEVSSSTPLRTASPIISTPNIPAEPATPGVRMNLADRYLAVETASSSIQQFPLTSTPKPPASDPISQPPSVLNFSRAPPAMSRPAQSFAPPLAVQKTAPVAPPASSSAPSAQGRAFGQAVPAKTPEKRLQQKKVLDPVMIGIHEEIEHFQKELDELKTCCRSFDFRVGSTDEMRELRKESENLHVFAGEIKDTTESVHGDIRMLKTSLLEGFAGAEEAIAQSELNRDKDYLQLLYKKPLDPRREEQLKEIRRMYQYVKFAMEDVNDVLDLEWEKHLEKRKKQRHMVVPERESLFTALANHLDIINQQKHRLEKLLNDLHKLRLYKGTSAWSFPSQTPSTPSQESLDSELESLKDALLKASLDSSPRAPVKSPSKMTPAKQTQLRNFLSKRQTPPVRSTAPANLSRSAFLFPQYSEDEVSSTSSLSQPLESDDILAMAEEEEEPGPIPIVMPSVLRHPAVVRTPSIQPGFSVQSDPFSRVVTGLVPILTPKIIMDSADSTAFATKTVKHGAPPTERSTPSTIPATQAAAIAALNRQMTSQKPVICRAPLTESTLKVVPQVVNVQELRDEGPPAHVSTVIRRTVGGSECVDFLECAERRSRRTSREIGSSVPAPAAQVVQQVLATVEASKNSIQGGLKVSAPLAGAAQSTPVGFLFAAPADSGVTSSSNSKAPSGFSFSAAAVSSTILISLQFLSIKRANGFFRHLQLARVTHAIYATRNERGEDLGSISQVPLTETSKLPPAAKAQGGAGETLGCFSGLRVGQTEEASKAMSFSFGSSMVPKAEGPKTTTPQAFGLSSTFTFKPQEGTPLSTTPAFTIPSTTSFPPAATSFNSLLQAPLPETVTKSPQTEASSSTELAVSEVQEPPTEPTSVDTTVPSTDTPSVPSALTQEVTPAPATVTQPAEVTPVTKPPAEPFSAPGSEVTNGPPPTPASQEPPAASVDTPSAPPSDKPGSIFAPSTAAPSTQSNPPPPGTAFGSPGFSTGAGFGQPAAPGSASGFTFGQSAFGGAVSGFGQPAAPAAATTTSSDGGGLFGSSTGSGASSFSFAPPTSSTSSTGAGHFGQSSAPVFGQPSSGFGQGSLFGNNTTTSSSSGFGFGQQSVFGSSTSSSSVFGQQTSGTSVFGQAQSGGGLFGSSAANASSGSGFFSGLGGKPSEDAANKNPFGSTGTVGFGQSAASGSSSLFGNSAAKGLNMITSLVCFGNPPSFGRKVFGEGTAAANMFVTFNEMLDNVYDQYSTADPTGFPAQNTGFPAFGSPGGFGGFGNTNNNQSSSSQTFSTLTYLLSVRGHQTDACFPSPSLELINSVINTNIASWFFYNRNVSNVVTVMRSLLTFDTYDTAVHER
ncbi:Nuclear pore complex protein [Triplophysa tibetana]|uniref:Nuclear pore complex protein Nup214 n=1 Tax=Triplophysa tibetana TaxID=1572043 RepID=A0A5A9P2N7_9TELE|nr:Nuclear pore complex protein [Triplophysa tibetana]